MFDIGFAELIIIGIVALVVIGPERLPEAIRTGSAWLNRLRRGFNDIKQEVQQELHNDSVMRELRDSGEKLRREGESLKKQFNSPLTSTQSEKTADKPADAPVGSSKASADSDRAESPGQSRD